MRLADLRVNRLNTKPVVDGAAPSRVPPAISTTKDGAATGVNSPTLIQVPAWIPKPLGRFYMYSSAPTGKYIRLSYADDVAGPYTTADSPAIHIADVPICGGHMSGPTVVVDDAARRIVMHYHCGVCVAGRTYTCGMGGEVVFGASSSDGVHFETQAKVLWKEGARGVKIGDWHYLFAKHEVFVTKDGLTGLKPVGGVYMSYPSVAFHQGWLYFTWSELGTKHRINVPLSSIWQSLM